MRILQLGMSYTGALHNSLMRHRFLLTRNEFKTPFKFSNYSQHQESKNVSVEKHGEFYRCSIFPDLLGVRLPFVMNYPVFGGGC